MGWFSDAVSWVVDDVLGIDLPDTEAAEARARESADASRQALDQQTQALRDQTAIAQRSSDQALQSQKAALAASEAALMPTIDSEGARKAGESRQRRLQQTSPWGIGLQRKLGAAPTGFRVLSGQ